MIKKNRNYTPGNDAPLHVDLVQSVLDMRKVFSNMAEVEFAAYYSTHYRNSGLRFKDVMKILRDQEKVKNI